MWHCTISLKSREPKFSRSNSVCVLPNCQIADRYFLEFSYFRMLKSRIEECSILFFRFNNDSATLFYCTESQFIQFIKVRIIRKGLFIQMFLINIGRVTDVRVRLSRNQHNNNNTNNNY